MTHRIAPWVAYLAVGVAANLAIMLLPRGPGADAAYVVVALSGCFALMVGARLHRPDGAAAWYLLALGMIAWIAGGALVSLRAWFGTMLPFEPDLLKLAVYPLAAAGITLFTRSRNAGPRPAALLDAAVITISAGLVATVFLVLPAWSAGTGVERWLDVLFPMGNLLLFGALVRLAYVSGAGRPVAVVVATGLGTMLVYQGVSRALPWLPVLDSRATALAPEWLLPFVLAGTVALHPSMRRISATAEPSVDRPHGRQVAALGLALGAGPVTIGLELLAHVPLSAAPVALFYVPLVVLVTLRMLVLVQQINDQAITDVLTGLPNRRSLHRESRTRLADHADPQALLMLDLDRFKEINDSLGHHAGDELLVQVADRLRTRLRSDDLLVRLGGDEFAILLEGAGAREAEEIAASLGAALRDPFDVGGLALHSSASIGIALFPLHGTDLSTLMRKADVAMYRAKSGGGHRMHDDDDDDSAARLRLSEEFRVALDADQLLLHFQPKLDLDTGAVRGVEALVRWQHPTRGLLLPEAFLGLVETAGLMGAMTRTVLDKAMTQAVAWRAAGRDLSVAVNLSASSLVDVALPEQVARMLAAHDLPPTALQLEITEEFLMVDRARARTVLTALRSTGITIAVDDFGTGYSSLAYLRDLPIDELKLDRTFVSPMADDALAAALVSSTIGLAHSLGLRMVAEGVEDGVAYDELTRLGCDQAQGYFMSRPLPADELELWFLDHVRSDAAVVATR